MTAPGDVALAGCAKLSALGVRARLLTDHDRLRDVDTRALHHPV